MGVFRVAAHLPLHGLGYKVPMVKKLLLSLHIPAHTQPLLSAQLTHVPWHRHSHADLPGPCVACMHAGFCPRTGRRYSLLEYALRDTEQTHGKMRRYTSPDEHAFFPSAWADKFWLWPVTELKVMESDCVGFRQLLVGVREKQPR